MAEYSEVIKQFDRMCLYYSRDKVQNSCPICTSYPNCNIGQCRKIAFEQPECFDVLVMAWAADHPEPVYPTWEMYLAERMIADMRDGKTHNPQSVEEYMRRTSIPADIAEKLGIEPKEGT